MIRSGIKKRRRACQPGKAVIIVDIDAEKADTAKRALDVAGHYARPDVFTLTVNKQRQAPARFENE